MFTFSFFSLAFVGLMPVIAEQNLGIDPKSTAYGVLYACFGLGAALGAVTRRHRVRAARRSRRSCDPGFVAFAVVLAVFALLRAPALAYPVSAVLGYVYFVVITSLSTVLQARPRRRARGAG